MKAPKFWHQKSLLGSILSPLGLAYYLAGQLREYFAIPFKANIPVICVGNAIAGGAGKTPTAILIGSLLREQNKSPHFISRGYGSKHHVTTPVKVDISKHSAANVGDEPLLLSRYCPCWVCTDRKSAIMMASAKGADIAIMDDGFQNPTVAKDLSLLVIDGYYGNGNGHLLPAGPLRQPFHLALRQADAVIFIGEDKQQLRHEIPPETPIWFGHLKPTYPAALKSHKEIIAFAGIGRPEKFCSMLENDGYVLKESIHFGDHQPYRPDDIEQLESLSRQHGGIPLVTTEKDAVRLPDDFRKKLFTVPVKLVLENESQFADWLMEKVE